MTSTDRLQARTAELRAQGVRAGAAAKQAHREAVAEQDRRWREAGWREQGGSREGWGLI